MERERVADSLLQLVVIVDHRERADQPGVAEHFGLHVGANPRRRRRDVDVLGRDLELRMAGDRGQEVLPRQMAAVEDRKHDRQAAPDFGPPEDARSGATGGGGGDFDALRDEPMAVTSV